MSNLSASTTENRLAPNREHRIAALRTIEELNGLTLEELGWIADAGTERSVRDGELVFSQGAPPCHLLFVLEGEIAVKRHTSSPVAVVFPRNVRIASSNRSSQPSQLVKDWVWVSTQSNASWPSTSAAVAFDTSAQGTTFHVRLPLDRAGIY